MRSCGAVFIRFDRIWLVLRYAREWGMFVHELQNAHAFWSELQNAHAFWSDNLIVLKCFLTKEHRWLFSDMRWGTVLQVVNLWKKNYWWGNARYVCMHFCVHGVYTSKSWLWGWMCVTCSVATSICVNFWAIFWVVLTQTQEEAKTEQVAICYSGKLRSSPKNTWKMCVPPWFRVFFQQPEPIFWQLKFCCAMDRWWLMICILYH